MSETVNNAVNLRLCLAVCSPLDLYGAPSRCNDKSYRGMCVEHMSHSSQRSCMHMQKVLPACMPSLMACTHADPCVVHCAQACLRLARLPAWPHG